MRVFTFETQKNRNQDFAASSFISKKVCGLEMILFCGYDDDDGGRIPLDEGYLWPCQKWL